MSGLVVNPEDRFSHNEAPICYSLLLYTMWRLYFAYTNYINVFGVGVSRRELYSFVVYLYVNGSGSITSVGEERANLSAVVYL